MNALVSTYCTVSSKYTMVSKLVKPEDGVRWGKCISLSAFPEHMACFRMKRKVIDHRCHTSKTGICHHHHKNAVSCRLLPRLLRYIQVENSNPHPKPKRGGLCVEGGRKRYTCDDVPPVLARMHCQSVGFKNWLVDEPFASGALAVCP